MKFNRNTFLALGLTISIFAVSGCAARNNAQLPNQNNTQQGRNMLGENLQGVNPNADPRGGDLGTNRDPGSGTNPQNITGMGTNPNAGTNPGLNNIGQQLNFDAQKANDLGKQLGSMEEVQKVKAIVRGNTALVGYTPTDTKKDAKAVRDAITNRIKQIDGALTNVIVTDSADIMTKINQLSTDITNNKPMNELSARFNQMMQGIQPGGAR